MRLPYLTTSVQTDILATLLLIPLWWVLGFGIFIYQFVAIIAFIKLWGLLIRNQKYLKIPVPAIWLLTFLIVYAGSLLINFPNYPVQRVIASLNNYSYFVMGLLLIIVIYECDPDEFLKPLCRIARTLCVITGLIAVLFLCLWFFGDKAAAWPALIGRFFPGLLSYPFFENVLNIRITAIDWSYQKIPRLSIYSAVVTTTGGFMLILLPLARAYAELKHKFDIWDVFAYLGGILTLLSSVSRTAIAAYFVTMIVLWIVEKKERIFVGVLMLGAAILSASWIYDAIYWIFESRSSSTEGRFMLYEEAINMAVRENILLGIGVRVREEYTAMSIGSHSTYVGFFLMTGLLGLCAFLLFQAYTFAGWIQVRKLLSNQDDRALWKYLGSSFLAVNIWLLTDGVDGVPFITYAYFLLAGALILFCRSVRMKHEQAGGPVQDSV